MMPSLRKCYVNVNDVRSDHISLDDMQTNSCLCKLIKKIKTCSLQPIVNVHTTFCKLTNCSAGRLQAKNVDVN